MHILGYSGLHQSVVVKRREFPGLLPGEYRIAQGFDSAAALVCCGEILRAAAEERFTGEKATGLFPINALKYCVSHLSRGIQDVDIIAHCFDYDQYHHEMIGTDYAATQYRSVFNSDIQRNNLSTFFPDGDAAKKFRPVAHHLCHAASAYYLSNFDDALILVSDGMGEIHSLTIATGYDGHIHIIEQVPAFHSLGILYGVFTMYLGFEFGLDEYKVMGLAPYGNPRRYYSKLSSFVELRSNGTFSVPLFAYNRTEQDVQTHRGALARIEECLGPRRTPGGPISSHEMDVAAALQAVFQHSTLHVLRHFQRLTGLTKCCLAGGAALNCSANGVIKRSRLFKRMFVQPASGDDGAALGAALYLAKHCGDDVSGQHASMPFWGPAFTRDDIRAALLKTNMCSYVEYVDFEALARDVAVRLAAGSIVGWFQDNMEFGPRALGNRSILADPRCPRMRLRINQLVKQREDFRPFAPAVQQEHARKYFEIPDGDEGEFWHMQIVTHVLPAYRELLPAVTHVDGSARVQVVEKRERQKLWSLLEAFAKITNIPILLNTSFNVRGQPIVRTPIEAIDTFIKARLDCVVLDNFVVVGTKNE